MKRNNIKFIQEHDLKPHEVKIDESGVVPDIIMNPNDLPKRMTIVQAIECVFSNIKKMDKVMKNTIINESNDDDL